MPKKKTAKKTEVSKFQVDESRLKAVTIPNPVVVGGVEEIGLNMLAPIDIPKYLFMHPALPRGIEIKANRLVTRVDFDLEKNVLVNPSESDESKEAREYCKNILYNSDSSIFLKKMTQSSFRFGTGFCVLQPNVGETEVLRFELQHPVFFGPAKYPLNVKDKLWGETPLSERSALSGKKKINSKTKKIEYFTQLTKVYPQRKEDNFKFGSQEYVNTRTHPAMKEVSPGELAPVGPELHEDQVATLVFDTIGDEPLGIPLVQFLHLTIKYLLNMERAGAQTMVNFGFNKWVANTPFKDDKKMKLFAKSLANIQKDSVVVLPDNIDLKNIVPGTTEFNTVHPIYMQLIAIRLGIPVPLLVLDGTQTNRSTLDSQKEDMFDDFFADEIVVSQFVNELFFKACKVKYPKKNFDELKKLVPTFKYNEPPEDKEKKADRLLKNSLTTRNISMASKQSSEAGNTEVAELLGKAAALLVHEFLTEEFGDWKKIYESVIDKKSDKKEGGIDSTEKETDTDKE